MHTMNNIVITYYDMEKYHVPCLMCNFKGRNLKLARITQLRIRRGELKFLVITIGIFLTSYIKVTLAGIFAERIDQIFAFQNRVQRIFQCKFGHFHAQ